MCPDICVVVKLSVSKHWREYEGLILTSGLASFFLYPPLDLWWKQHWSLCRYDCGGCVSTTLTSQLAPSWVTICEYCMLCWYCLCTANLLMTLWLYIDVWCTSFIYLFFQLFVYLFKLGLLPVVADPQGQRVNSPPVLEVGSSYPQLSVTCCNIDFVLCWCFCPALRSKFSYLKFTKMQHSDQNFFDVLPPRPL